MIIFGCQPCPLLLSASPSEQTKQVLNDSGIDEVESDSKTMHTIGQLVISLVALVGGLITAAIGLATYRQNQALKKKDIMKDIIVPLIAEYDSDKFKIATDLLDNKGGPIDRFNGKMRKSTIDDLPYLLRDRHGEPAHLLTDPNKRVREAFDAFINFLIKLEYLVSVGILDKDEHGIDYFSYFIDLAAKQNDVLNYIEWYRFPLRGILDTRLKVTNPPKLQHTNDMHRIPVIKKILKMMKLSE